MHFKCERQPFGWVLAHKLSHTTKTAHHLDALFFKTWGPQKILCTFGDKEYASKRVSIILIMRFQTRSIRRGDNRARQQRSGNACISKRACSVTGAQGRKDLRKGGETALFEPDVISRHIKKSTTHNVARFLMWWGQQGSNL